MLNDAIELLKACDGLTVEEILAYKASKEPKLTLEVGKRYWRRDGTISQAIHSLGHDFYPFCEPTVGTYTKNGRVYEPEERERDLIREYIPYNSDWDALCNAVREIDQEAADYMEVECPKLKSFYDGNRVGCELQRAFKWIDTPQGFDYWKRLLLLLQAPFGYAAKPKKKYEVWINLYANGSAGAPSNTEETADRNAREGRVECRKIEWEA